MATTRKKVDTRTAYFAPPKSIITKRVGEAARQISELWDKASQEEGANQDSMQHIIDLFTGKHELGIPEDKRYVAFDAKSNKPADVIFRVMGMLMARITAQYISPSTDRKDNVRGDLIEQHINALYPGLFKRYLQRPDVQALFWQLLVGTSYIQQSYDPYYWDKNELSRKPHEKISKDDSSEESTEKDKDYNERVEAYRQFAGPPIVVESLDPRSVLPIRTKAKGIIGYVKKYRVTRYDFVEAMRDRGRSVKWEDGKVSVAPGVAGMEHAETADTSMAESMDYYEYIDDNCIYYVCDNEVIDEHEHKGAVKVFPGFALQTGFSESHLSSVGILWPVRNEITQLDFFRTLWANKAYLEIFPQLFAILDANEDPLREDGQAPTVFDLEPGTVKQVRGKIENPMANAASGTDFRALIEMAAVEIDSATIPGIARGQAGAQQPGYAINQLAQSMRTLWRGIIESRELQWGAALEHYLWLIRYAIKQDTSVFAESDDDRRTGRRKGTYATIKPADVDDHFKVEVTLNPDLPIDEQGRINLWWMLYKEGGADWDEFVRKGKGQTNPIAQLRQIRKEAMEKEAMGQAMKDAMALGQVRLENRLLKEQGFTELNETFSLDVQKLKASRTAPQVPGMEGMAGPAADGSVPPEMPMPAGPAADGSMGGTGIPPTAGMNPVDSAPGPRLGDMSSGNGLR